MISVAITDRDQLAIATIRTLCIDAVHQSGARLAVSAGG